MGAYQGFIDGATGSAAAIDRRRETEAAHFDAIVGATVPRASAPRPTAAPARPAAALPASARPASARPASARRTPSARRSSPARALGVFAALSIAGVVAGAGVIVAADATVHGPLTSPQSSLDATRTDSSASTVHRTSTVATASFGSSVTLGDQLAVSVSTPSAYTPSPKATGAQTGVDVVSTVTVTNVGSGSVDPSLDFAIDGTTGTRLFDRIGGIRLNTIHSLPSGRSVTYRVGFSVADLQQAIVIVKGDGGTVRLTH